MVVVQSIMRNMEMRRRKEMETKKRLRTMVTLQKLLSKNYNQLGLACFAGVVTAGPDGAFDQITFLTPQGSEIENCLNDPEIRIPIIEALKMTQAQSKQKTFNISRDKNSLPKPPVPLLKMNYYELAVWYPKLLRYLYWLEGGTHGMRMYAKLDKDTGEIIEPTPLKIYDEIAEKILPRSNWLGCSKKQSVKNIKTKLQGVAAYILGKLDIDHETFSAEIHREEVVDSEENDDFKLEEEDGKLASESFRMDFTNMDEDKPESTLVDPAAAGDKIFARIEKSPNSLGKVGDSASAPLENINEQWPNRKRKFHKAKISIPSSSEDFSDSELDSAADMRREKGKRKLRNNKKTGVGIDPEFLSRSIARLVESTMDRLVQTKYSKQF